MKHTTTIAMLKNLGILNPEAYSDRHLNGFASMTQGITDPELLKKKVKDWRKIVHASHVKNKR